MYVEGEPGADSGWLVDFADIDAACAPVIDALDHRYLNEIEGLDNPTSEHLAMWIWPRVAPVLPGCRASSCARPARRAASIAARSPSLRSRS